MKGIALKTKNITPLEEVWSLAERRLVDEVAVVITPCLRGLELASKYEAGAGLPVVIASYKAATALMRAGLIGAGS